jgi:NADH-ubiquinone oxidoreductase chain 1
MTEHAAVIFVFFFLAEYASIVLMCIFTSILFLGGYLFQLDSIISILTYIYYTHSLPTFSLDLDLPAYISEYYEIQSSKIFFYCKGLIHSVILGIKTSMMVFIFI